MYVQVYLKKTKEQKGDTGSECKQKLFGQLQRKTSHLPLWGFPRKLGFEIYEDPLRSYIRLS